MLKKERIAHPEYGNIEITRNPRARRIILRARPDTLHITLPLQATWQDIEKAIEKFGDKLKEQQRTMHKTPIRKDFRIDMPLFKFGIELHDREEYYMLQKNERYILLCPATTAFEDAERQEWIRKAITGAMRKQASKVLPLRLQQLARKHKLCYKRVSIRNSKTRWGSCSSNGTISLNLHLIALPCELIDYVLLHELCHTVEMNHSERFWRMLDNLLEREAKPLRNLLKSYRTTL